MQRFKEDNINDKTEILITLCGQNEMGINNNEHKCQYKYTYEKSKLSYRLYYHNQEIHPNQILDISTVTGKCRDATWFCTVQVLSSS